VRTLLVVFGVAGMVALACLLAVVLWYRPLWVDPAAAPELSLPPALVTPEELGGRRALFDGRTPAGWEIEGPYRVEDGTLELGGAEAARAVLKQSLEEGERVEFAFFEEGPAGARLWIKPTLIDPQPPDPDYCKEFSFDLNLSQFAYRRWHTVRVSAGHRGTDTEVTIDIRAQHGGPGRGGGGVHSLPARGGCRHQLVFEVAPGAKLYLRNVLLGRTPSPK
jgi:hypothetical protein